jgi:hypothetical protein
MAEAISIAISWADLGNDDPGRRTLSSCRRRHPASLIRCARPQGPIKKAANVSSYLLRLFVEREMTRWPKPG